MQWPHPSPALVIACVALAVSIGGTIQPGGTQSLVALCNEGEHATGGSVTVTAGSAAGFVLEGQGPQPDTGGVSPNSSAASATNGDRKSVSWAVRVVCAA